jgi:hypothetical protein
MGGDTGTGCGTGAEAGTEAGTSARGGTGTVRLRARLRLILVDRDSGADSGIVEQWDNTERRDIHRCLRI